MRKSRIKVYDLLTSVPDEKVAIIDGSWSTAGSTNMNRKSFPLDQEVNVIALDNALALARARAYWL